MLIPKTLIHETAALHLGNELLLASYYKNRELTSIHYYMVSKHSADLYKTIQTFKLTSERLLDLLPL